MQADPGADNQLLSVLLSFAFFIGMKDCRRYAASLICHCGNASMSSTSQQKTPLSVVGRSHDPSLTHWDPC
jgi:hypothetical protein